MLAEKGASEGALPEKMPEWEREATEEATTRQRVLYIAQGLRSLSHPGLSPREYEDKKHFYGDMARGALSEPDIVKDRELKQLLEEALASAERTH